MRLVGRRVDTPLGWNGPGFYQFVAGAAIAQHHVLQIRASNDHVLAEAAAWKAGVNDVTAVAVRLCENVEDYEGIHTVVVTRGA